MGDQKIKNPELIHRIPLSRMPPTVKVDDTNRNGVLDHQDSITDRETGEPLDVGGTLQAECDLKRPRDTAITVTPEAATVLQRNGAAVERHGSTPFKRHDELVLPSGVRISSAGGYDASIHGCHYNRSGFQIEPGSHDHEVLVSYEDGMGFHRQLFDLLTGKMTVK
jgi:hypothetical protein